MYCTSTQKKFWTFESQDQLEQFRLDARRNFINKLVGGLQPPPALDALLTVQEEQMFLAMVEENAMKFCRSFDPPLPTAVIYTAFVLFKRFYLHTSVLDYLNVKNIMTAIIYLASKIEEAYLPIENYVARLTSGRPNENMCQVRNLEPIIIGRLKSHLLVHEPFTPMEGLLVIATNSQSNMEENDMRLRNAAEKFLWNSLSTDVCLLYPPSQIALAAIYAGVQETNQNHLFKSIVSRLSAEGNGVDKSKHLMKRVYECYSIVASQSSVPIEFKTVIQQRIEQCAEFIHWANNALQKQRVIEPELASYAHDSSSDESVDLE